MYIMLPSCNLLKEKISTNLYMKKYQTLTRIWSYVWGPIYAIRHYYIFIINRAIFYYNIPNIVFTFDSNKESKNVKIYIIGQCNKLLILQLLNFKKMKDQGLHLLDFHGIIQRLCVGYIEPNVTYIVYLACGPMYVVGIYLGRFVNFCSYASWAKQG